MADCNIVSLLEGLYGERLVVGHEAAFYPFTREKAEQVFDEYRRLSIVQEFTFPNPTLFRNGPLLVKHVASYMTRAAGGVHTLHEREKSEYRHLHRSETDVGRPRPPGESLLNYLLRSRGPKRLPIVSIESEVRQQRIVNLKSLLLTAPSVTIPDQVWILAAERMLNYHSYSDYPLRLEQQWSHLIDFLAVIRPLIDQGAVRIVSARRMEAISEYNESSRTPDRALLSLLDSHFCGEPESIFTSPIVKYLTSLPLYNCSAFYESQGQVDVHQAAIAERVSRLNRATGTVYTPTPAVHTQQVMKAAESLTVSDLAEVRLNERKLQEWFQCYSEALESDTEALFRDRLRDGFDRVASLQPSIVSRALSAKVRIGVAAGTAVLIDLGLSSIGIAGVMASLMNFAAAGAAAPLLMELFGAAPENDIEDRAKQALKGHFMAFDV